MLWRVRWRYMAARLSSYGMTGIPTTDLKPLPPNSFVVDYFGNLAIQTMRAIL